MSSTPERDSTVSKSARRQSAPSESPARQSHPRPTRPPPITPQRFTKFFTPRPFHGRRSVRTSRAALRNISGPALNQRSNDKLRHCVDDGRHASKPTEKVHGQKRKLSLTSPESTPQRPTAFFLPSSQDVPGDHEANATSACCSPSRRVDIFEDDGQEMTTESEDEDDDDDDQESTWTCPPRPALRQHKDIGTSASLLHSRILGRRTRTEPCSSNLWQYETSGFYSSPYDVYSYTSPLEPVMVLPFCTASCNTNSLVAIGDEQGGIRILDSAKGDRDGFTKHYLALQHIHNNAMMDLTFSEDDALLATAAGDQESHIVDMQTQQTIFHLCGHTASVKRVQFQPGSSSNVLATCSRDGNINIWDLRSPADRPSLHLRSSSSAQANGKPLTRSPTDYIRAAHTASYAKYRNADEAVIDLARERGRYSDSSVTSLAFLPDPGRSHLLVSSSEADSTIKLWDMRTIYNARRPRPHPVSTTEEPPNHPLRRRHGLTSLAFSGDGARLYGLCRDHTVYVYSTSHLILGDAPELSVSTSRPRRPGGPERPGLGPLYAFRHPEFSASTFYLRLAIRKATAEKPELLAIGSSNNCAIIFPTSERYLNSSIRRTAQPSSSPTSESIGNNRHDVPYNKMRRRLAECKATSMQHDHSLPIYDHGTALIRGHEKEVTAVTWNYDGSLTTISDDFTVRCWREDDRVARNLRQDGEGQGRRWRAGWADVRDKTYDNEG